ncbi:MULTISPECIES: hypothetical protein [Sphingobacterium]|uniref:PKD domain-containing protein n=1 Tax=Sphingobacterium ginsenosidimutans TaxID=687845 RepID=A0ABP8AGE9_9SPHI|nr:hypothetical protein [Sphingobacterium sp. E70]ULT22225.1 hypothetical protein KUH03_22430 [Sphingobacterium sp. E70]
MKTKTQSTWGIFSCLFIVILAVAPSCKKNTKLPDESNEKTHAVTFKIKDFETIVTPLKAQSPRFKSASTTGSTTENQLLYHWNFDNGNADPTLALEDAAVIDYNNGKTDYSYVAGWPTSGKGISFKGAKEVLIKIPGSGIATLASLSFDANSSGTGPRALLLSYSTDQGATFKNLTDTLHYPPNLTTSAKFVVEQSLRSINLVAARECWLKIALFSGNREGGSNYNESTGTFKMDNVKIMGTTDQSVLPDKLYYHIFDANSKLLVKAGTLNAKEKFNIALPMGTYYLSLLSKNSGLPLMIPASVTDLRSLSVSNAFSEQSAAIFAVRDTFDVKESMERVLTMSRIYSEVKFECTDVEGLDLVDSIQIKQLHKPFRYYPFATGADEQVDKTLLRIIPNFSSSSKSFVFNQFMGDLPENKIVKYELHIFRKGELMRTFDLGSEIRNNVQLLFKGKLLDGANGSQGFQVMKNEKWRDNVVIEY